ncbi:hypothetical protein MK974_00120 [Burkholderia ambifaria]|uniref:hypothetical protein n=1 Tax=Burkholderia ambifaria TaxID=152480 RepID=UPI0022A901D8|nr:hypothetical protein [Burkholderia ambifaria]WAS54231.1 hypothetical protein MK974_00120 [Burkholderia ambifaria]
MSDSLGRTAKNCRIDIGRYLPSLGTAAVLIGIALESAHAYLSWTFRAEMAHAIGFFGIVVFAAGTTLEARNYSLGWQPIIGLAALAVFVSCPAFLARDWLIAHSLSYFAAVGQAIASFVVVGIVFFAIAPFVLKCEKKKQENNVRKGKVSKVKAQCWWMYLLVAIACQLGSFWYELWQQPFVAVSISHPARGFVEWGQVIADAAGIWLGFFFAKFVDPTIR